MMFVGVLKRVVPFLLTFAAGLFIASFFVSIASPSSFSFPRRHHKFREMNRLREENRELKLANEQLRKQLEESRNTSVTGYSFEEMPNEPPPPPPPRRHPRFDR